MTVTGYLTGEMSYSNSFEMHPNDIVSTLHLLFYHIWTENQSVEWPALLVSCFRRTPVKVAIPAHLTNQARTGRIHATLPRFARI